MSTPVSPSDGLGVLHLFLKVGPGSDAAAVRAAVAIAVEAGDQVVPVAVLGHKADVAFMALGDDMWRLRDLHTALFGAGLEQLDSYLSLT